MRLSTLLVGLLASTLVQAAVDVNQATEADLDGLKGLGPTTTRRILAERDKAPFQNWQDLMARVKGLGAPTAQKLSEQGLTVGGQAYPGPAPRKP